MAERRKLLGHILLYISLCRAVFGITTRTPITLINNGYTGLLIAIHEQVPENLEILNRLQITDFCDDDGDPDAIHNQLANNQQNKQCGHRSNWAVMNDHTDFADNTPLGGADTLPIFTIVKARDRRTVLIMDVSGSMFLNDRLNMLVQAATRYIRHTLPLGSWLGLVEFSTSSRTTSPLTQITNDQVREDLIALLPVRANGNTCIGCGILEGIQVLENSTEGTEGGILFIISDGEENIEPYLNDVMYNVTESQTIVDTLAFSEQADFQLTSLSTATGGKSNYYSESPTSTALHDGFTTCVIDRELNSYGAPVQQVLLFLREFSTPDSSVTVDLTSPSGGVVINEDSPEYSYDKRTKTTTIHLEGQSEVGSWAYIIRNGDQSSRLIEISIESRSGDNEMGPMKLTSSVGSALIDTTPPQTVVYAELRRGHSAVINANVVATVERPDNNADVRLQLLDNGGGADVTKEDGVYSAYFLDFVKTDDCINICRYTVKVEANDDYGTAGIQEYVMGSGALPTNYSAIPSSFGQEPTPIGEFDRTATGGVIQLDDSIEIGEEHMNIDLYPPSRIADLKITNFAYADCVQLGWTASGDDFDQGTATSYDLRTSTTFFELKSNFSQCLRIHDSDLIEGTLLSPHTAGSQESVTVSIPTTTNRNMTYYFAIVAIDEAANHGDISVIASISATMAAGGETIEDSTLEMWLIVLVCLICAAIIIMIIGFVAFSLSKNGKDEVISLQSDIDVEISNEFIHTSRSIHPIV
ncbi:calcium-activated chloride channel regulator 4A-like [Saccoglossus kowalevskii]|uniref:Calcium-activated chloride channel regulator 4-like n=1 Tax=Saccoglossus kowalevskii TaxID=10224 RepID=A0ABM0LYV2_SACKO|nr:PREDICTED: calcium-activated chloride channel regulator 4-like [Saccoglossus kowalevskii]